eukprot:TRINITY_DN9006_c0_g1_i1.p1 TRINITY_DN9006_c0_g1~~TRINITY_DN9006_c0_g1_i1.p1  ORF type:complete len:556 (-),score=87.35 TRINITY_DN9006_c0_g1_i1:32-1699(-)
MQTASILVSLLVLSLYVHSIYGQAGTMPCFVGQTNKRTSDTNGANPLPEATATKVYLESKFPNDTNIVKYTLKPLSDSFGLFDARPKINFMVQKSVYPTEDNNLGKVECANPGSCELSLAVEHIKDGGTFYIAYFVKQEDYDYSSNELEITCTSESSASWIQLQSLSQPTMYHTTFLWHQSLMTIASNPTQSYRREAYIYNLDPAATQSAQSSLVWPSPNTASAYTMGEKIQVFKDLSVLGYGGGYIGTIGNNYAMSKGYLFSQKNDQDDTTSPNIIWTSFRPGSNATDPSSSISGGDAFHPGPRFASGTYLDFNKMYLYGGYSLSGRPLNDFYIYNNDTNIWTQSDILPAYAIASPVFMKKLFKLLLFGYNDDGLVVWSYSSFNSKWSDETGANQPKVKLVGFALADCLFDIMLVGGYDVTSSVNSNGTTVSLTPMKLSSLAYDHDDDRFRMDIYIWSFTSSGWVSGGMGQIKGDAPAPRAFHSVIAVNTWLYMIGGITAGGSSAEMWKLNMGSRNCLNTLPIAIIITAIIEGIIFLIAVFCICRARMQRRRRC